MNTVDVILTATGFLHFSSGRGVVTQESGRVPSRLYPLRLLAVRTSCVP